MCFIKKVHGRIVGTGTFCSSLLPSHKLSEHYTQQARTQHQYGTCHYGIYKLPASLYYTAENQNKLAGDRAVEYPVHISNPHNSQAIPAGHELTSPTIYIQMTVD